MKNENNRLREKAVMHASAISIAGNTVLAILKAAAGLVSGSSALLSDAVHSVADLSTNVIVIFGVHLSAQESDQEHPYGHERFECVAAIVLAVSLLITGMFIGLDAIQDIRSGGAQEIPGGFALAVAALSIAVKEFLFRYTWLYAQKHGSSALKADAWHHRSDALCSLGVFIGVAGARMGISMMDSIASLMICGCILQAAYSIFRDAVQKMVDHACSGEVEEALLRCAQEQPNVMRVEMLHTREFGSRIYADMEIRVDGGLSLKEGYQISRRVHDAVETQFPQVKHISICIRPDEAAKNSYGEESARQQ